MSTPQLALCQSAEHAGKFFNARNFGQCNNVTGGELAIVVFQNSQMGVTECSNLSKVGDHNHLGLSSKTS
jgi:hypothetical protein